MDLFVPHLFVINIAEFDAETRFRTLAFAGSTKAGLALLDKLGAAFASPPKAKLSSIPAIADEHITINVLIKGIAHSRNGKLWDLQRASCHFVVS